MKLKIILIAQLLVLLTSSSTFAGKTFEFSNAVFRSYYEMVAELYSRLGPVSGCIEGSLQRKRGHSKQLTPPRKLVDVGGYGLHLYCSGENREGVPTIILEAGAGKTGADWMVIQHQLSMHARVCSYDRAGLGWSDPSPSIKGKSIDDVEPRTIHQSSEDLHRLLNKAGIVGPLLLVGHSYGGAIARMYEKQHPEHVHGLLLIDPSVDTDPDKEDSTDYSDYIEMLKKQFIEINSRAGVEYVRSETEGPGIEWEGLRDLVQFLNWKKHHKAVISEDMTFHRSVRESDRILSDSLSLKPLTIISQDAGLAKEEDRSIVEAFVGRHGELARLMGAKHIIAKGSGHDIPQTQPGLVVREVLEVLHRIKD